MGGFAVGHVLSLEPVPGKDKLLKLQVNVGSAELGIVTNASNVTEGSRVVVATIGTELSDGTVVKKANVGGCPSEGMLCDAPMLGWTGGGAGAAALVPESYAPGDSPPATRPRLDMPKAPEASATPAVEVKPLFEKKLTKEEKKAAAAAKKAEREAKKAGAKKASAEEATEVDEGVEGLNLADE